MPEYKEEKNVWINTESGTQQTEILKCYESTEGASVNFGELGKATFLGGAVYIEDEWKSLV